MTWACLCGEYADMFCAKSKSIPMPSPMNANTSITFIIMNNSPIIGLLSAVKCRIMHYDE